MEVKTVQVETLASSLGPVLIALTRKGVAAVLFGDTRADLEAEFARRFPRVARESVHATALALTRRVLAKIDNPAAAERIPLDPAGTGFQCEVWRALQSIPAGTTISYKQLAQNIGKPQAVRAVANACGANPVAVLIPCHRVIATSGALTGYRWGLKRKQELLTREHNQLRAAAA